MSSTIAERKCFGPTRRMARFKSRSETKFYFLNLLIFESETFQNFQSVDSEGLVVECICRALPSGVDKYESSIIQDKKNILKN